MNCEQARAATRWDEVASRGPERSRYWHSPRLCGMVDDLWRRVTGYATPTEFIFGQSGRDHFPTALSIGCGSAGAELTLLEAGAIDRLILSDISGVQLERARENAQHRGLDIDRIEFRGAIDLSKPHPEKVDLVYWQQSLHHMLDTEAAIAWSLKALKSGGAMYCHDACAPNRMQFSSDAIDWTERFRAALPKRLLASDTPTWWHSTRREPESAAYWLDIDPTECADSASIVPSLRKLAPQTQIYFLGGMIYGYAMHEIIANFDENADAPLFEFAMLTDELLSRLGYNCFFTSLTLL